MEAFMKSMLLRGCMVTLACATLISAASAQITLETFKPYFESCKEVLQDAVTSAQTQGIAIKEYISNNKTSSALYALGAFVGICGVYCFVKKLKARSSASADAPMTAMTVTFKKADDIKNRLFAAVSAMDFSEKSNQLDVYHEALNQFIIELNFEERAQDVELQNIRMYVRSLVDKVGEILTLQSEKAEFGEQYDAMVIAYAQLLSVLEQ